MPTTKPTKTGSRRDNFTQSVIQILFKRAGGKCCRCQAPTFGPVANNPTKTVNIGQAAHIAAAAPGGPRYDETMTPEERASASNGMWMCSNCHDIIDRDEVEYTTAKLKKMKREAESRAKSQMGVGTLMGPKDSTDGLAVGVSASTIVEIRKSKANILAMNGEMIDSTQGEEFLTSVSFINPDVDTYLPDVGRELVALFDQLAAYCTESAILLEVLRRVKIIADCFNERWTSEDVEAVTGVIERVLGHSRKRSRVYRSGLALLKDLCTYPALRNKGLHEAPAQCLRELTGGGDMTDGDKPPETKRLCVDAAGGPPLVDNEDHYLELMHAISQCTDVTKVAEMEEELASMGYDPDVV